MFPPRPFMLMTNKKKCDKRAIDLNYAIAASTHLIFMRSRSDEKFHFSSEIDFLSTSTRTPTNQPNNYKLP